MMLEIGSQAPEFTLPDHNGEPVSLSDFRGQTVVLYFYPKDSTPGCTRQARAFADVHEELRALGAVVLGVSRDSSASHLRFIQKNGLPFRLLSDPERTALEAYGVWQEKKLYGKVSMGIVRTTYLIDGAGIIRASCPRSSRTKTRQMCWPCSGPEGRISWPRPGGISWADGEAAWSAPWPVFTLRRRWSGSSTPSWTPGARWWT